MRVALFCHSLLSDWNHGNAHFLRGIVTELAARGHAVRVFEPRDAWSAENLAKDHGPEALTAASAVYPYVTPWRYDPNGLVLDDALDGVDLVLVHEWNDPALVRRIGEHRRRGAPYRLLFHDTHHRSVTDAALADYDLSAYDGVLAFGRVVRDLYLSRGWAARAYTWHEAADVRVFHPPRLDAEKTGDVVWIGNWGDDERTAELSELLFAPAKTLSLRGLAHGVRYPEHALRALAEHGFAYGGWLPNFRVPEVFARHDFTVHVPRRPYATALPGIPTIRVFEALACGIPLVCAPWDDAEGLFTPGEDYLVAEDGAAMARHMRTLLHDDGAREALARHGRKTILARHTCAHRTSELLAIAESLGVDTTVGRKPAPTELASGGATA